MFSTKTVSPAALRHAAITRGWASVGKPGYGLVAMGSGALITSGAEMNTASPFVFIRQPISEKTPVTGVRLPGSVPVSSISPPAETAAERYVAAAILSGITRWRQPGVSLLPSMAMTGDPAPLMFAPSPVRYRQRSVISGSLAALTITVSPSAAAAARRSIMAFSVAPTEGNGNSILAPLKREALHFITPSSIFTSAPSLLRA